MNNCTIFVILFYPWRYLIVFWWLLNQITWNKLQSGNLNRNLSTKAGRDACLHVSFAKEFSFIYFLWFPPPLFKVLLCNIAQTSVKWGHRQKKGMFLPIGNQAGLLRGSILVMGRHCLTQSTMPSPAHAVPGWCAGLLSLQGWAGKKSQEPKTSLFSDLSKKAQKYHTRLLSYELPLVCICNYYWWLDAEEKKKSTNEQGLKIVAIWKIIWKRSPQTKTVPGRFYKP